MDYEERAEQFEQLKQNLKNDLANCQQIENYFNENYLNRLKNIREKQQQTPEAIINCDFFMDSGYYCFGYESSLIEINNIFNKYRYTNDFETKFLNFFKLIIILKSI